MRKWMLVGACAATAGLGVGVITGLAIADRDGDDDAGIGEQRAQTAAPVSTDPTTTATAPASSASPTAPPDTVPPMTAAMSTAPTSTEPAPTGVSTPSTSAPPEGSVPPGNSTFALVDGVMTESFDGVPTSPEPWGSESWDVSVHSRDRDTWDELETMEAMHGEGCEGPPETHEVSAYEDAVFQCNDHVMTAVKAGGFGGVFMTPGAMVDFSDGVAVVRVDVSTLITSDRDYWDVWITPFDATLQLPSQLVNGVPESGVRIRLNTEYQNFETSVFRDGETTELDEESSQSYEDVLVPDAARRDTFEITISKDNITVGMPDYGLQWFDAALPELGWSRGVVQFAHHSYNPAKADSPDEAHANTWHWDNVEIAPAVPFTMIGTSTDHVGGGDVVATIPFDASAPDDARLRFAGIGDNLEISVDGGSSWQPAEVQWESDPGGDEHFQSYFTAVPAGTDEVLVRGSDWWGGEWRVRDVSIWAPPADS